MITKTQSNIANMLRKAGRKVTVIDATNDTTRELLGQFIDRSVVRKGITTTWFCLFCKDEGNGTPERVRHKHQCLVARAKDHLGGLQ